jgi:fatty acid synthase
MMNTIFTDHPEIPVHLAKLYNINKFDAPFFSVHYKQAQVMDPQCQLLLQKTYEAVVDAG